MKKNIIALACLAGLLVTGSAHANLITNGSFESPGAPSYTSLPGGSTMIPGWTTVLNGVEWFNATSFGGAADGEMAVDLANFVYTNGGITQTFATVANQHYSLAFALGTHAASERDGTAHFEVTVAGNTTAFDITNLASNIVWTNENLEFTATGTSTTLTFANDQNPWLHFAYVDGVSVTATGNGNGNSVPEPSALALMALGLAGLGATRRRKA